MHLNANYKTDITYFKGQLMPILHYRKGFGMVTKYYKMFYKLPLNTITAVLRRRLMIT